MPDPRDEFDTADRALWAKRFQWLVCCVSRVENCQSDEHASIVELKALDLQRQAEHAATLEAFAAIREELAVAQKDMGEIQAKYQKLTEHLKRRFQELRDEFKADRSTT
jgi:Skp family chaperone for outer membrane proteins